MTEEELSRQILEQVYRFAKSAQPSRVCGENAPLQQFTLNEFSLMLALCRAEEEGRPFTMTEVSRLLGISAPAATQLVLRLCHKGWVHRQRPESDRRQVVLTPTPAAREAADSEAARQIRCTRRFVALYGEEKSEAFLHELGEIYRVFQQLLKEEIK